MFRSINELVKYMLQKPAYFKNSFSYPLAAQITVNVLVFLTGLIIGYLMK